MPCRLCGSNRFFLDFLVLFHQGKRTTHSSKTQPLPTGAPIDCSYSKFLRRELLITKPRMRLEKTRCLAVFELIPSKIKFCFFIIIPPSFFLKKKKQKFKKRSSVSALVRTLLRNLFRPARLQIQHNSKFLPRELLIRSRA